MTVKVEGHGEGTLTVSGWAWTPPPVTGPLLDTTSLTAVPRSCASSA